MKSVKTILMWIGLAALLVLSFFIGRQSRVKLTERPMNTQKDTLYIRDTITAYKPIYERRIVRDSVFVPADTIRLRDTLFVFVERESVEWEDSLCLVYASGVGVSIDSVRHYVSEMVITREVAVKEKSRWGLGITAGYGATRDGLSPYVGVGITWNILSW